jgi:hypothetical protein
MPWPKPSVELREKLRQEIHRWKPWEHSRKKYTTEWAEHLQAICKKVDGYYSSAVAEDRRRLRETVGQVDRLIVLNASRKERRRA